MGFLAAASATYQDWQGFLALFNNNGAAVVAGVAGVGFILYQIWAGTLD